jgi:hypothetical protein
MQQLAQKIYETTPGIKEGKFPCPDSCLAFPKNQSVILQNFKNEDLKGPKRAMKFLKHFEQID